jgi:hypothetical protein
LAEEPGGERAGTPPQEQWAAENRIKMGEMTQGEVRSGKEEPRFPERNTIQATPDREDGKWKVVTAAKTKTSGDVIGLTGPLRRNLGIPKEVGAMLDRQPQTRWKG